MSSKKLKSQQKALLKLYKDRKRLLAPFLSEHKLVEGSYVQVYQKCGRAGCHCENNPTHLVTRLSRWVDGKLKHKVVRIGDRKKIEKLAVHYKQHKEALKQLNRHNDQERKIMEAIIKQKKKRYE